MLLPREAGKFIASKAKHVTVHPEGIRNAAVRITEAVKEGKLNLKEFKQNEVLPLDKGLSIEQLVDWVFLIDALNFNFWTPKKQKRYKISRNGKVYTGYLGMVASVNRAIDEGKPMYDPNYYGLLTSDELKHIFRSDTSSSMPLINERIAVLQEISSILKKKYNNTFNSVLQLAAGSAIKLVEIVTNDFPCFNDVASFEGQQVAFFKRAQILAADIHTLFQGKGLGHFRDIDDLTMFADYRVPQSLVHFGAMSYSKELMNKLGNDYLFKPGETEEVEIRGCSIEAIELITAETKKLLKESGIDASGVNSIRIDYFLWDFRLQNARMLESVPFHKVRSIFY